MLWPTYQVQTTRSDPRFRVLYVGNDVDLVAAVRVFFTKPGHEIMLCMDCRSAVLFLKGDPRYDLLVFDLELRDRVFELTGLAGSLSHRKQLPIMIVTATEDDRSKDPAGHADVDAWVVKRDPTSVALAIARLLPGAESELVAPN